MKRILFIALAICSSLLVFSQALNIVESSSSVTFKIKNFGFNTVDGSFSGLQGTIVFDPNNLSSSNFNVSVSANTVNTGIKSRDNHLRKEEYFDVSKYPRIKFVSTKVTKSTKDGTLFMFGKLTIKGTTKDISFPFTATPQQNGYVFKGSFKINRIDYGVGGSSTVGDNATIFLSVFARKG